MTTEDPSGRDATIAVLAEPLRRAMFRFVASQPDAAGRDQVAERFTVSRAVAAFHLDRLAEAGLLDVEYRRPPGRSGPGAGRPAKLYRATTTEVSFSIPPREYEIAGRLLAEAVTLAGRDGAPVEEALTGAARSTGHAMGGRARDVAGPSPKPAGLMAAAWQVLSDCSYDPRLDGKGITLVNCPFRSLARDYTDLVCGMNLSLMEGFIEELGDVRLCARLEPREGQCCVRLRKIPPGGSG